MEVLEQWEEEVVEVALQGRRPRHQNINTTTFTTSNGNGNGNGNMDFKLANKSETSSEEEGEDKGRLEKSVYFDNDRGTETITVAFSGIKNATVECSPSELNSRDQCLDAKLKNLDIGKILSTVINNQGENLKGESSHEEEDVHFKHLGKEAREDEESEEEVIELEFERAVEKLDTHTMYCPNCNSCITKVILRRRKRVPGNVLHPKPVDLLGCLSCFKIFIPTGSDFNPFWIFGYGRKNKNTQVSQQIPAAAENLPSSDIASEKGKMVIEQENDQKQNTNKNGFVAPDPSDISNEALPDQSGLAPSLEGTPSGVTTELLEGTEHVGTSKGQGLALPGHHIINVGEEPGDGATSRQVKPVKPITTVSERKGFDILKSIVYGGLVESIASLSVVSSAAAADATTLNIVALGLANLIGGIFIIGHNLLELKNDHPKGTSNERNVEADRYQELLGQRGNFLLHATVAVLSFLVFGLIPPVTYGFSFRKSGNGDLKLVAVAAASLLCIAILAFGKAHIQRPPRFYMRFKIVLCYVLNAILVSGVSYVVGHLIKRLMEKLGWFESSVDVTLSLPEMRSVNPAWGSY